MGVLDRLLVRAAHPTVPMLLRENLWDCSVAVAPRHDGLSGQSRAKATDCEEASRFATQTSKTSLRPLRLCVLCVEKSLYRPALSD